MSHANEHIISAAIIGTGHFATAIVTQAQSIPELHVPILVDINVEAAQLAYKQAGIDSTRIVTCESYRATMEALEQSYRVILPDASLLVGLPMDVVVEATGIPEAGACYALATIEQGKHVVMVNKEADAVIGPILAQRAQAANVVYMPADGDQHGLLIALVQWARRLGLEVICCGKARDTEYVYNLDDCTVTARHHTVRPNADDWRWLKPIPAGHVAEFVAAHDAMLAPLPQVGSSI